MELIRSMDESVRYAIKATLRLKRNALSAVSLKEVLVATLNYLMIRRCVSPAIKGILEQHALDVTCIDSLLILMKVWRVKNAMS